MPTYEYRCEGCGKNFSVNMHMAEHDRGETSCPECKGKSIVQQYGSFFAKTSKKS
jgi:putative FmdB family regulatory protein